MTTRVSPKRSGEVKRASHRIVCGANSFVWEVQNTGGPRETGRRPVVVGGWGDSHGHAALFTVLKCSRMRMMAAQLREFTKTH